MSRWDDEVGLELERSRGDGRFVRVRCPACPARTGKDDLKNSLSVNVETGWWLCFKCDARGRVLGLDDEPEGTSREERLAEDSVARLSGDRAPLPDVFPLAGDLSLSLSTHREYLVGRGIPENVWAEAGLCGAVAGRYAGRVVVPVVPGELSSGFVARSVHPGPQPKYLCPKGMSRALLYNSRALHSAGGLLLAVEGSFDALAHWPDAVAFLGKPTEAQVDLLSRTRRPVAVVLDPDAWREGEALCLRLRVRGVEAGCVVPPPGLDAALLPREFLMACGEHSLETVGPVRLRG